MPIDPTDYLELDADLTDEERAIRDTVRKFVETEVRPIINAHWRDGRPLDLYPRLAELGLLGTNIDGYGCAALSPVAYGLVMRELERELQRNKETGKPLANEHWVEYYRRGHEIMDPLRIHLGTASEDEKREVGDMDEDLRNLMAKLQQDPATLEDDPQ